MEKERTAIQQALFAMRDEAYGAFQRKLVPNVAGESIIGVRTPALRQYAKSIAGTPEAEAFLSALPHTYYEENNLHAFLIERIKGYDAAVAAVERFLPYVDNWATCDSMSPKVFKKHLPELYERIRCWIASEETYTIRFGIEMLMSHYLEEAFRPEMLELAAGVRSEEYYVNMMIAWYLATALAKQYAATLPLLTEKRLGKWVHNKTIQKAVESYRITDEQKAFLRTLRVR